jgi:hypothetical protein
VRERYGAFAGRYDRHEQAEALLREGLPYARRCGEAGMLGQVQVSLGLVLQHTGRLGEARDLLAEGLRLLPPAHAYAIVARSHLEAINSSGACGCGDTGHALAQAFRQYVLDRLTGDFRPELEVEYAGTDFNVKVHVDRQPTPEQLEHFQRVLVHARTEFHERVRGGRWKS